jgi:flagellar L-ring protein precursor FlgH
MTPARFIVPGFVVLCGVLAGRADADQLYTGSNWASIASDNRARGIHDIVSVLIYESASASNSVTNKSSKQTSLTGGLSAGSINESGDLKLGGGYNGTGEIQRSDKLVATMAAQVVEITANGDFVIEGRQTIHVNGEDRIIAVRGLVRPVDISSDDTVPSSRLANAQIDYDGKGFVSRSAKPGIINKIFSFLGLS